MSGQTKAGERQLTVAVPPSLKKQVEDLGWVRRTSASEIVRLALGEYIEKHVEELAKVAAA